MTFFALLYFSSFFPKFVRITTLKATKLHVAFNRTKKFKIFFETKPVEVGEIQ